MTVGARLYRVEQQLSVMDRKLDQLIHSVNVFTTNQNYKMLPSSVSQMHLQQHHSQQPVPIQQLKGYRQASTIMTAQQLQALQLPPHPSKSPSPVTTLTHLEDDV